MASRVALTKQQRSACADVRNHPDHHCQFQLETQQLSIRRTYAVLPAPTFDFLSRSISPCVENLNTTDVKKGGRPPSVVTRLRCARWLTGSEIAGGRGRYAYRTWGDEEHYFSTVFCAVSFGLSGDEWVHAASNSLRSCSRLMASTSRWRGICASLGTSGAIQPANRIPAGLLAQRGGQQRTRFRVHEVRRG